MDQSTQSWLEVNQKAYFQRLNEPMDRRRYEEFANVHVGNPLNCDGRGDGLWGHCSGRWFKLSAFPQVVPGGFAITPDHIQSRESCGMFGRSGIESNASHLIRYAQEKGDWVDFTAEEVNIDSGGLDYLVEVGFLLKDGTTYRYTMGLVFEFYSAYPAEPEQLDEELSAWKVFFKGCIPMQTILKITAASASSEVIYGLFKNYQKQEVTIFKDGQAATFTLADVKVEKV